ncbi:MAG: hypothetical protein II822_09565 [Prevotella sp.]|nr:hypothetical protein [Prevotella sp.]
MRAYLADFSVASAAKAFVAKALQIMQHIVNQLDIALFRLQHRLSFAAQKTWKKLVNILILHLEIRIQTIKVIFTL